MTGEKIGNFLSEAIIFPGIIMAGCTNIKEYIARVVLVDAYHSLQV
jgi:hypothetical protein